MMKRLLLSTILTLGIFATPVHAQGIDSGISDATASEYVEAPREPTEVSDVATGEGQAETTQGDPSEQDAGELARELPGAVKAGKWIVAFGILILLIVGIVKAFDVAWAKTRGGGYVLGYGLPLVGALGLAMKTGYWSIDLFVAALGAGAVGGAIHGAGKDVRASGAG